MSKALLVLGMHRSGTSALTGTLKLLGAEVGNNLMTEANENPKGFWEHAGIVELHEQLLTMLGSSWHDERALPDNWWRRPEVLSLRQQIELTLQRDFSATELWAVKDPRMCRLMPLWHEILDTVESSPRVILILRNPLEVAASLRERDGINTERGLLLWLRHILEAERATRVYPRAIITYEQLLSDWRKAVESLDSALDLTLQTDNRDTVDAVEQFLEPALRHHDAPEPAPHPIAQEALSVYHLLAGDGENGHGLEELGRRYEQLSTWNDLLAPWLDCVQRLHRELNGARETIYQREREIRRLKKHPAFRLFVRPWLRS